MPLHDKAFYFALFFILGTLAAGFDLWIGWALIGAFLIAKWFFKLDTLKSLILLLILFFGFFYFHLDAVLHKAIIPTGETTNFTGTIIDEPREGIDSTRITVRLDQPHQGELWAYLTPGVSFEYGEKIYVEGTAEVSPSGAYVMFSPKITKSGENIGHPIKRRLINLKTLLVGKLEVVLPAEHASLASGLLLGERAEFTDEFEEAMRQSGTTHIVALSGYNIAILVLVISNFFSYIWNRRAAFYVSLLIIPLFVVMTGASPSVVRAGIMGLILLLAEHQSRSYSSRNAITLTAFGMILFDPTIATNDVGFQLSFAALLGIVYLYPVLEAKFNLENEGILSWKKNALQTAAAQIAVLPIILSTFGSFSPLALVSNVLILEFIPITMLLSFITIIFGFISFHLSLIVGWVTSIFLAYEIFIINLFGISWF